MAEIEDIKKLDPKKRVERLKDLIEKRNKDIEEAKKLSEQAKKETDELIALREKINVPELEEVNIANLFEQEEENLEQTVKKEAPDNENSAIGYQVGPEMATKDIYSDVQNIYNSALQQGNVTAMMAEQAGAIQYAMEKKEEDIKAGSYMPGADIENATNAIKDMADKILSIYNAGVKKKNGI